MEEIFVALARKLDAEEAAVLVFVLEGEGSTPRKSGSVMLIAKDEQVGTIGGGSIEYQSTLLAREILESGQSQVKVYDLTENDRESLGMICGGKMKVAFYCCGRKDLDTIARINQFYQAREECYLTLQIMENDFRLKVEQGKMLSGGAKYQEGEDQSTYRQPLVEKGTVYLFGGGHISRQLADILGKLSFPYVVTDNDLSFLQAFEENQYKVIDFENVRRDISFLPEDYAIIVTRGHQYDKQVLNQLIDIDLKYLGMIGSRQKIKLTYEAIAAEKPEVKEKLLSVHAPIGLSIGAQTPEEIAVSIAAELIQVRCGR